MTRRTVAREVDCEGVALHAGKTVRMRLAPADVGAGVRFRRTDLGDREIAARYDLVKETRLGTTIGDDASVAVIEHVMAAVTGAGIDDLVVALDGPEPPILAGDAESYLALFDRAGTREIGGARRALVVKRRVEVKGGEASAALTPADALSFDFEIAFDAAAIGTQRLAWNFSAEAFRRDIAPARTFGFVEELETLNKLGLAKGASLENTLAIEGGQIVNKEIMRFPDEFVRHKILDAIGDLALAGGPIIGRFEGRRSGHALNNALLRELFSDPRNYEWQEIA